jgi:hypothetical protein
VYERAELFPGGEQIVREASETWQIPVEVVDAGGDAAAAVEGLLSG